MGSVKGPILHFRHLMLVDLNAKLDSNGYRRITHLGSTFH